MECGRIWLFLVLKLRLRFCLPKNGINAGRLVTSLRYCSRSFRTMSSSVSSGGSTSATCSSTEKTMEESPDVQHLRREGGNTVAYRQTAGKNPGVMFLPGFMSNMNGGKAVALERFCKKSGLAYVRFDYQGLGDSNGSLEQGVRAFDVWRSDALAVLDQLTSGPQILVGSSMGGAIMLLLALERPQRIQALIGVATAVNFTKPLSYTETEQVEKSAVQPTEQPTYVTPKDFVDKRYQRCLMDDNIPINCPVRLLHGMRDDTVPFMTSLDVAKRVTSRDVDVVLRKDGDHRMSHEEDLQLLTRTLESLVLDTEPQSLHLREHKL